MGKNKKKVISNYRHHDGGKNGKQNKDKINKARGGASSAQKVKKAAAGAGANGNKAHDTKGQGSQAKSKTAQSQQSLRPIIPFSPTDRILLVGEGDFSFALSLATHHRCTRMLATCYDPEGTLYHKYPQAKDHVGTIQALAGGEKNETAIDATKESGKKGKRKFEEVEEPEDEGGGDNNQQKEKASNGDQDEKADAQRENVTIIKPKQQQHLPRPAVLFGIDARQLGTGIPGGGKTIRKGYPRRTPGGANGAPGGGPWDVICFNFPHVGGLSTDVNRQVRSNQELLVSFFKAAAPLLSPPPPAVPSPSSPSSPSSYSFDAYDSNNDNQSEDDDYEASEPLRSAPGQILVTLFEGEPYTLWNIRDLARHCNLRVVRSFKFPWSSYPGYSHARTCGEIIGKNGGKGGWRGEDREARTFIFEKAEWAAMGAESGGGAAKKQKKTKGKGKGDESDSE